LMSLANLHIHQKGIHTADAASFLSTRLLLRVVALQY